MIAGRRYWILIWYGILLLGLLGLWASIYWGRRTAWRHLDELLRACGTIMVSTGMLLLLYGVAGWLGRPMLLLALGLFIGAFIAGRRQHPERGQRASGAHKSPELPFDVSATSDPPSPPEPPARGIA
jgi:CHASE2 domain-containing sensor protein